MFHTLEHLRRYCEDLFEFAANGVEVCDMNGDVSRSVSKVCNPHDVRTVMYYRARIFQKMSSVENPLDLSGPGEVAKGYDLRRGLSVLFDPPIPSVEFVMKLSHDEHIKRLFPGFRACSACYVPTIAESSTSMEVCM